jgi:biopolymer transport protein ExbD
VAAPLSTVDVAVDLPASAATPQPRPDKPLFLSVQKDLSLHLGDAEVKHEELAAALEQATKGDKSARIFLRADKVVEYGALMEVMNLLRTAGYLKVALVGLETLPPAEATPPAETPPQPAAPDAAGSRP